MSERTRDTLSRVLSLLLMSERKNKSEVVDQGAGVCPFGKGVVLGSDLPDSINVGRTAPLVSGFAVRELARRDVLVRSERVCFFVGLGVSGTAEVGVGAASESDWPALFVCDGLGLFSRSAARAPAIRICSRLGSVDADFLRNLGLGRSGSGVADSGGVWSGGGAACFGASGFVSRATMTSCARVWPTSMLIAPEESDAVISRVKGFGRVENFQMQTQRLALGGSGMSENAKTKRDKVELNITISREEQEQAFQQTSLRIRTSSVDEKAKELRALAEKQGGRLRSSTFSSDPNGREVASVSLRVAMKNYPALMAVTKRIVALAVELCVFGIGKSGGT